MAKGKRASRGSTPRRGPARPVGKGAGGKGAGGKNAVGKGAGSKNTVGKGAGSKNTAGKNAVGKGASSKGAPSKGASSKAASSKSTAAKRKPAPAAQPEAVELPSGPFRLGAIAGATPGKWIGVWRERLPEIELELVPIAFAAQREALSETDAALVRLPIDKTGLHVIPLYDEVPVAIFSAESHLAAADELTLADLAGEVVIVPGDDVLATVVEGALPAKFAPPETTEQAVAIVAAGVGVVIVPMSLARAHDRKDVEYRRVTDAPHSTVALAWESDRQSALVDAFVGIVRGRTANSSR